MFKLSRAQDFIDSDETNDRSNGTFAMETDNPYNNGDFSDKSCDSLINKDYNADHLLTPIKNPFAKPAQNPNKFKADEATVPLLEMTDLPSENGTIPKHQQNNDVINSKTPTNQEQPPNANGTMNTRKPSLRFAAAAVKAQNDKTAPSMTSAAKKVRHANKALSIMTNESVKRRLKERITKMTQERLTIKQIFQRYVESSTLHGFVYTCSDTFFIRRFIWACLMIMGAIYFIIKLKEGIIAYYSYPFTTLSTIEYLDTKLPFPSVSFCTVNQFKHSELQNSSLYNLYMEKRLPLHRNWSDPKYEIPGEEFKREYEKVSLTIEDIFKECDWISRDTNNPNSPYNPCGPNNFTTYISENEEVCFTLNSGQIGHELLEVGNSGLRDGYQLMFDIHNARTIPYNDFTGMKIIVHHPNEAPTRDNGFLISPGFKTFVSMQPVETHNLPPPFRTKCGEKKLKYFEVYNRKSCLIERLTDYVADKCGCREMFMPDNKLPYCSLKEIILCVYPAKGSYNEHSNQQDCPIDCHITEYETRASQYRYMHNPPKGIIPQALKDDAASRNMTSHIAHLHGNMTTGELDAYIEENVIVVILFYGEMSKTVHVQAGTFGFYKFLGNMGGEIGLMLGASLLTFVEFVDLILFLLYHQLLRLNKNKQINDQESTQI